MAAEAEASWFPSGGTLTDEVFARRHRTLRILLALHGPVLLLVAQQTGQTSVLTAVALLPVLVAAVGSGFGSRALRAAVVAAGLAACSADVIAMSGGIAESHYHALVMVAFIALYQDWVPFLGFVLVASLGYALAALAAPHALFDAPASGQPLLWAVVHVGFLVAEALALVVFWRATEHEQSNAAGIAAELALAELERTREQTEARQAASELLSNLARRNQALLDRQLQRIDALEQGEQDPEALAELFSLDHLATRMRRNAESLLVLSGGAEPRPWGTPAVLSEICRGAMAEVEDYARVDVVLGTDVLIHEAVVGDLVHLAAELIENATTFSPPTTRVLVSGNMTAGHGYVFAITDAGIGMSDIDLAAANATLLDDAAAVAESSGMLGLHVVARLAARYGIKVWLQRGTGGGLSAMVAVPPPCLAGVVTPVAPVVEPEPSVAPLTPIAAPLPVEPVLPVAPVVPAQAAEPLVPAGVPQLTAAGLQRRVPKASLVAELAHGPEAGTHVPVESVIEPARARSVLSAFSGGAKLGRNASDAGASADPALGHPEGDRT